MSKDKIEPMSVESIKDIIHANDYRRPYNAAIMALALAWIHAEARAREKNHWYLVFSYQRRKAPKQFDSWKFDDWLAQVKAEVGWPNQSE